MARAPLVSLVGFRFEDTRLAGVPIPGHRRFDEVNLRFYAARRRDGTLRRAVVFIRELVPRRAIAAVARWLYNEPYLAVRMGHAIELDRATGRGGYAGSIGAAFRRRRQRVRPGAALVAGSEAEFITEHYWGYTRQRDGGTLEYEVMHRGGRCGRPAPRALRRRRRSALRPDFARILAGPPQSAFVAVGSPVSVFPAGGWTSAAPARDDLPMNELVTVQRDGYTVERSGTAGRGCHPRT